MPASIPTAMSGSAISSAQFTTSTTAGGRLGARKSPTNATSQTIPAARTGRSVRRMSRVAARTRSARTPIADRTIALASPSRSGSTTDMTPGWWPAKNALRGQSSVHPPQGKSAGNSRIRGMVTRKRTHEHERGGGHHAPGGVALQAAPREGQEDVHNERPPDEARNPPDAVDRLVARERQRHDRERRTRPDKQESEPARPTGPGVATDADQQRDAERIERGIDRVVRIAAHCDGDGHAGQQNTGEGKRSDARPPRLGPPPEPHRPGNVSSVVHAWVSRPAPASGYRRRVAHACRSGSIQGRRSSARDRLDTDRLHRNELGARLSTDLAPVRPRPRGVWRSAYLSVGVPARARCLRARLRSPGCSGCRCGR